MKNIITYNPSTGEILNFMRVRNEDGIPINSQSKEHIETELDNIWECYVDPETKEILPFKIQETSVSKTSVLANGSDEVVISNIPDNATLHLPIGIFKAVGEALVLTFTQPGKHHISVLAPTFKTFEVVIDAN